MVAVVKRSAEAQATDILRDQIIKGQITAGAKITEIQLSDDFQVSRATVRTALHHLVQEGLVVQVPYTGWTVINLSAHDAWELYTLRASLESLAAGLAAHSRDTKGREKLRAAHWDLMKVCQGNDLAQAAEADFTLHDTIVGMAGHKRLADQYRVVGQQVKMYIVSSDALMPDLKKLVLQHQPIVDAVINGRSEEAARLSEQHNTSEGEILVAHLRRLEALRRK